MVSASTLMYGSSFCRVTLNPRLRRSRPRLAVVIPLPMLLTTPPVTKIYFVLLLTLFTPSAHRPLRTRVGLFGRGPPPLPLGQYLILDLVLVQNRQDLLLDDVDIVGKRLQLAAGLLHQ